MLFAAEGTAGVGGDDSHLCQREPHDLRDDVLESERVLDRTEDNQSIVVRGSQKDVGFYGEVCDHGEPVGVLDDPVGRRGLHLAPAKVPFTQDVRVGQRVGGT